MQTEKINKNLVLKNATIIDPFRSTETNGDIYIKEGKVPEPHLAKGFKVLAFLSLLAIITSQCGLLELFCYR